VVEIIPAAAPDRKTGFFNYPPGGILTFIKYNNFSGGSRQNYLLIKISEKIFVLIFIHYLSRFSPRPCHPAWTMPKQTPPRQGTYRLAGRGGRSYWACAENPSD
jgi:hypothetical protein